jgi:hypothetical protein
MTLAFAELRGQQSRSRLFEMLLESIAGCSACNVSLCEMLRISPIDDRTATGQALSPAERVASVLAFTALHELRVRSGT